MKIFLLSIRIYISSVFVLYLYRLVLRCGNKIMYDEIRKQYVDGIFELANMLINDKHFTDLAVELYILGLALKFKTSEKMIRLSIGHMIKERIMEETE